jgi:hypothetical protein
VLLTAEGGAKVGDVGLARFMAADYMSAQAALGTFSWTVRIHMISSTCVARGNTAVVLQTQGLALAAAAWQTVSLPMCDMFKASG